MLKPAKNSLVAKNLHLWNSFSGGGVESRRVAFECPTRGCGSVVLGVREGSALKSEPGRPAQGYFAICLHCSSAYVVLADGDEYYMRNLRDILDPRTVDEAVAEIKARMRALNMNRSAVDA